MAPAVPQHCGCHARQMAPNLQYDLYFSAHARAAMWGCCRNQSTACVPSFGIAAQMAIPRSAVMSLWTKQKVVFCASATGATLLVLAASFLFQRGSAVDAVSAITFPQPRLPSRALCILGMFRNEGLNIREWVAHYRWQGVSAVLLLDNGSTDAWLAQLDGFEGFVTVLNAPRMHSQKTQYNSLGIPWLLARGCEFVGVLDLDEFAYVTPAAPAGGTSTAPPHHTPSMRDAVAAAFDAAGDGIAQLSCSWLMFGSSGLALHPRGPGSGLRLNLTWRASLPHKERKSFVRLAALRRFKVHEHIVVGGTADCPPALRLNHYAIQSREFFEHVKMVRGDSASLEFDRVRDWAYFAAYDAHEEEDTALRDLVLAERAAALPR